MSTNALIPHARTELPVSTSQEVTTVIVNLDLRGVTVKQVTLFLKNYIELRYSAYYYIILSASGSDKKERALTRFFDISDKTHQI